MTVFLSPVGGAGAQFFDGNGNPLSGGKLHTYAASTTTPQVTYTSSAGTTPHSNPIILDAAGRVQGSSEIWLSDGVAYKFVLKDGNDVLQGTWDNVTGINSISGSLDAENVSYLPPYSGSELTNVEAKLAQTVSVKDFGAVGDGVTDDTSAFFTALTALKTAGGGTLVIPASATPYALKQANVINVDFTGLYIAIEGLGAVLDCTSIAPSIEGQIIKLVGGVGTTIVLRDFEMNGQYTDALGLLNGIRITGCDHLDVQNLQMDGFGYVNLFIQKENSYDPVVNINGRIANSIFTRAAYAGCIVNGNSVSVIGNKFEYSGRPSTGITYGYGVVVQGYYNIAEGNSSNYNNRYGIDVRSTSNVTVRGNYLYGNKFCGIYGVNENSVKKFSSAHIVDNEVDAAGNANTYGMWLGIYGTSSDVAPREIIIRNNIIRNCRDNYGILVSCDRFSTNYDLERLIIDGNVLYENTTVNAGIRLDNSTTGDVQDVIVTNNILKNSANYQIANAKNASITGNILRIDNATALAEGITCVRQFGSGDMANICNNIITSNAAITSPIVVGSFTDRFATDNFFNGAILTPQSSNPWPVVPTNTAGNISFGFEAGGTATSLNIAQISLPDNQDSVYVVVNLYASRYSNLGKADYVMRIAARNSAGTISVNAATVATTNYEGTITAPSIALSFSGTDGILSVTLNDTYVNAFGVANISSYRGAFEVL